MALLHTRWKLTLDIPGFLCWCFIALVFPLGFGTISLLSGLKCLVFLFVSLGLGEILLGNLVFIRKIPSMLRTGFSMLIGTYLLFVIFALCPFPGLLYILAGLLVIVLLIAGNFTRTFDRVSLAAILPICLLLLHRTDLRLATSPVFVDVPGDYFYYNVLVISLSKTLSIFDAVIHTGIPINYQSLTFFSPAALTYATGIPAHVALHGIFSPVAKVLSFSMLSASLVYLCQYVKGDGTKEYSWKYYFGASIALLLIAPLHPLYIARLDVKNFILLGEGYLLPIGVMGFALAVLLFGVMNFFFFSDEKRSYLEIGVFVVFLSSIVAVKTAMFFPLIAFYGLYSLIRFIKDRKDRKIVYVFLSLIGGGILMKVFFGAAGGMIKNSLTLHEGYFPGLFSQALEKFHRTPTTVYLLLFFLLMFFVWMGLKTLFFSGVFLSKEPFISKAFPIIFAALGCVLISILPGCFLKLSMLDESGKILQDDTFDTGQFMRAGLFISTAVGVMALLLLWGTQTRAGRRRLFQGAVIVWFGLAFVSFIKMMREPIQPSWTDAVWEGQVVDDFRCVHPRLMGMLSDNKYSGQYLVVRDVYPWWTCTKRGYSSGYVCTLRSNYRNTMIEQLLADSLPKSRKSELIRKMENAGVDALVATPANKAQFEQLLRDSLVSRPANSLWIYKIN
jgi:hypothetical protein